MKKTIGIIGGMGPLATADLFRKIVLMTDAASDNDHIRIFIDDNTAIPDRTSAILSGGADPVEAMADSIRKLEQCGADCLIMPCNTAHYFLPRLRPLTGIPFLSMLEATAKACAAAFPGKTAGVLATLAVLVAVRVTLLKNWNVRRVAWTMDDRALELDGRTILIGDIQSAFLRQHTMTRGVWTLTIWTKTPLRLAGVAVGPQRLASLHSLRQLSAALDEARGVEPQV